MVSWKITRFNRSPFLPFAIAYVEDLVLDQDVVRYLGEANDYVFQTFDISSLDLAYGYLIKNESFSRYVAGYFKVHDLLFQTCVLTLLSKTEVLKYILLHEIYAVH